MVLHEKRSDNTWNTGGATGLAEYLERITRFNELPGATELENTWAGGYSVIARTNTILNRIGNADLDNPALGERIRGEALFIRALDRKTTRLNSSHVAISYAVFCLKKKKRVSKMCVAYSCY